MQRYNDYGSMQQAAQRRVYEMQRRARAALEQNRCTHCGDVSASPPEPERPPEHEPEQHQPAPCTSETAPAMPASDPEMLILLAVLVLLMSEKADPRLIAALLYII